MEASRAATSRARPLGFALMIVLMVVFATGLPLALIGLETHDHVLRIVGFGILGLLLLECAVGLPVRTARRQRRLRDANSRDSNESITRPLLCRDSRRARSARFGGMRQEPASLQRSGLPAAICPRTSARTTLRPALVAGSALHRDAERRPDRTRNPETRQVQTAGGSVAGVPQSPRCTASWVS
jgi:hypothetical protein